MGILNKKKKLITCVLVSALAASTLGGSLGYAAAGFSDVKNSDWFYGTVENARDLGIISGYPDGTFRPKNTVTYGEFLAMTAKGSGLTAEAGEGHWASGFYRAAKDAGYYSGDEFGEGELDIAIPRKDMALIFCGLLEAKGLDNPKAPVSNFKDVPTLSPYEYYISQCKAAGLLSGYPDGSFKPEATLTRAEAAAAFMNLEKFKEAQGAEEIKTPEKPENPGETEAPDVKKTAIESRDELFELSSYTYIKNCPNIKELMDSEVASYLDAVAKSFRFSEGGDGLKISFSCPALPEGIYAAFRVDTFDTKGIYADGKNVSLGSDNKGRNDYDSALENGGQFSYTFKSRSKSAYSSICLDVILRTAYDRVDSEASWLKFWLDFEKGEYLMKYSLDGGEYFLNFNMDIPQSALEIKN